MRAPTLLDAPPATAGVTRLEPLRGVRVGAEDARADGPAVAVSYPSGTSSTLRLQYARTRTATSDPTVNSYVPSGSGATENGVDIHSRCPVSTRAPSSPAATRSPFSPWCPS